jgi:glycerol kinase
MLDNIPGLSERAKRGEILFGTIDSWLCYKFTGDRVHITDGQMVAHHAVQHPHARLG